MTQSTQHFREVQYMRQWWVLLILFFLFGLSCWGFVQQIVFGIPFGRNPGPDWSIWLITILFGILLPVFLLILHMTIEVRDAEVVMIYFPIYRRRILLEQIEKCEAITYRPIWHYGGWGLRWAPGRGWVYSISGNRGVLLHLRQGQSVLLGSQRADELADVIAKKLGDP